MTFEEDYEIRHKNMLIFLDMLDEHIRFAKQIGDVYKTTEYFSQKPTEYINLDIKIFENNYDIFKIIKQRIIDFEELRKSYEQVINDYEKLLKGGTDVK